MFSEVFVI